MNAAPLRRVLILLAARFCTTNPLKIWPTRPWPRRWLLIAKGPKVAAAAPAGLDVPDPLSAYIGGGLSDVKWRPIGLGVRQAVLKTSRAATARLLYIPAGAAVPDHGHRGTELTLVLQGAFRDETARFAAGDVEVADEDLQHKPVAEIGHDCICLAATNAPLRFSAWIPRVAQSLFGL
jgi:putative transcriptional regulator